jgi:hypothetical protein
LCASKAGFWRRLGHLVTTLAGFVLKIDWINQLFWIAFSTIFGDTWRQLLELKKLALLSRD